MKNKTTTITKEKIAKHLKQTMGLSALVCEEITTNIFSSLLGLIQDKKKVTLQNFATWKINHKNSRPGCNMKTGNAVNISSRNVLTLIASKSFKKQINKHNDD